MIRNLLENVLRKSGYNVSMLCTDSQTFFADARKNGSPDICLIDCDSPKTDWFVISKIIKATWPSVKLVLFGLTDNKRMIQKAISAGTHGYLRKEDNLKDLYQTLERLATAKQSGEKKIF